MPIPPLWLGAVCRRKKTKSEGCVFWMGYSVHDGVFAPWCAILKCIFIWKKVTNITSRTVLEIILSFFKTISISLKEKKKDFWTGPHAGFCILHSFHPTYFLSIGLYSAFIYLLWMQTVNALVSAKQVQFYTGVAEVALPHSAKTSGIY